MTDDRELALILDDWLAAGPTRMPDRVADLVATGIARQSQRSAWPPDWRSVRLSPSSALAATAVVVAIVAIVGVSLGRVPLGPTSPVRPVATSSNPASTAPPSHAASPSAVAGSTPRPISGPIDPGTYTSQGFAVPFTYTVPSRWWAGADKTTAFGLSWHDPEGTNNLEMLYDAYPPPIDATGCLDSTRLTDWSRPHTARDLVDTLQRDPAFTTSAEPTTLGGLAGWSVTVTGVADIDGGCERDAVYVIHWSDGIPFRFGIGAGASASFTVLDSPTGGTIVFKANGDDPMFLAEAQSVVGSFTFKSTQARPFTTEVFAPRLTYVLPAGWAKTSEGRTSLRLGGTSSGDQIEVMADVFPPTIDDQGCYTGIKVSRDAATALVEYWTSHPGLATTTPKPFSIGRLQGWLVVASRKPGWSAPCPSDAPNGLVRFYHLWAGAVSSVGTSATTLIALDAPDGRTLGIAVMLYDTPSLQDEAMAIVERFAFDVDP